jgi:glycosyltransferase involved in cell wall biosynthesis
MAFFFEEERPCEIIGLEVFMKPIQLVYILSYYPEVTTTFIDREVLAMKQLGAELRMLALRQPRTQLSEEQKELQKEVMYLHPIHLPSITLAHLYFLFTRPWRYLSMLYYLISRPDYKFTERRKALSHFSLGIIVANKLRSSRIDHIHVHIVNWALVGLVASRMFAVPYSVTAHAKGDIFVKPFMLREKFSNAKFVAACTRYNMDYLKQIGKPGYSDKVKYIYHGLDIQQYQRKHQLQQSSRPIILGVGQLKERKGFQILVEACAILKNRGVNFECQIVGKGPMQPNLVDLIQRLELSDLVVLLGELSHEEVFSRYEQANIFALPAIQAKNGDQDGIPNVILEAMAMELPIVSTKHSAIPEVVEHEINGLLVPPGDPEALAEALSRLISKPDLGETFGRAGRRKVADEFNPLKILRSY